MKRILLSLVVVGALAFAAVPAFAGERVVRREVDRRQVVRVQRPVLPVARTRVVERDRVVTHRVGRPVWGGRVVERDRFRFDIHVRR